MGQQIGKGLQGEDERHGEKWDLDQHGARRAPGYHLTARGQAQRVQAGVKEKMVGLVDAPARLKDPNATDIGYAGEDDGRWDDTASTGFDVAAIGRPDHCYRCGGMGRIAHECPTAKGKGKGSAKGIKGKEKGANGKGLDKVQWKGTRTRCFAVLDTSPNQLPWKSTRINTTLPIVPTTTV